MGTILDRLVALTSSERSFIDDLLALGALVAMVGGLGAAMWRWWGVPAVRKVVRSEIDSHTSQLRPNGGSSMRDEVAEIKRLVSELANKEAS